VGQVSLAGQDEPFGQGVEHAPEFELPHHVFEVSRDRIGDNVFGGGTITEANEPAGPMVLNVGNSGRLVRRRRHQTQYLLVGQGLSSLLVTRHIRSRRISPYVELFGDCLRLGQRSSDGDARIAGLLPAVVLPLGDGTGSVGDDPGDQDRYTHVDAPVTDGSRRCDRRHRELGRQGGEVGPAPAVSLL
jgi:hypothetical protein